MNSPFQEKFLNVLYRNDSSMFTDQHCNLDFYLYPEIEIKEFFKRMTWRMHNLGYTVNLLSKVGLSILHTLCSVLLWGWVRSSSKTEERVLRENHKIKHYEPRKCTHFFLSTNNLALFFILYSRYIIHYSRYIIHYSRYIIHYLRYIIHIHLGCFLREHLWVLVLKACTYKINKPIYNLEFFSLFHLLSLLCQVEFYLLWQIVYFSVL